MDGWEEEVSVESVCGLGDGIRMAISAGKERDRDKEEVGLGLVSGEERFARWASRSVLLRF